jgi:hypothetical protein
MNPMPEIATKKRFLQWCLVGILLNFGWMILFGLGYSAAQHHRSIGVLLLLGSYILGILGLGLAFATIFLLHSERKKVWAAGRGGWIWVVVSDFAIAVGGLLGFVVGFLGFFSGHPPGP